MEPSPKFFNPDAITKTCHDRLPHWDQSEAAFFITFRLADAVPQEPLHAYMKEREQWDAEHPQRPWSAEIEKEYHRKFTQRFERWLDRGAGECLLRDPACARIVADALIHFEGERSRMHAWVVMPNHVHILASLVGNQSLAGMLASWKGYTARRINEHRKTSGAVWQKSYFDRIVRDWEHFSRCARYIRNNPAKASLNPGEFLHEESDLVRRLLS